MLIKFFQFYSIILQREYAWKESNIQKDVIIVFAEITA